MTKKELEQKVKELEDRVRELESAPMPAPQWIPYPVYPQVERFPTYQPWYTPYYIGDAPYVTITASGTGHITV